MPCFLCSTEFSKSNPFDLAVVGIKAGLVFGTYFVHLFLEFM